MVENRHRIQVNIKSNMFRAVPEVVANDNVIFEVEVWDGATKFPLLAAYSYKLTSLKLGGQSVIRDGTLSGDLIVFELGTSEMTVPGKVEGTVQIFDSNNDRISSAKFDYLVKRDPSLQGSLPADNTSLVIANESLLTEAITKADNADNRIDNIVAQAGTDNTEIVDMRLRNDGTVAPTAGGHLRELSTQLAENTQQRQESANFALNKNTYTLKPLITFVDDDGYLSTYNKLAPLFNSKGVKFVSAVSSGKVGQSGYMTKEQTLELVNGGHEIASHGVNHVWLSQNLGEIGASYKALNDFDFKTENLVYVGGDYNDETIREAKKFYNSAVNVAGQGGVNISPIRSYALPRVTFAPATARVENGINVDGSLASYKAMVDYAVANNGWLIWMLHTNGVEYTDTQHQYLSDLIDYIKSLNVEIVTLKEGLKKYGNKIDVGDTSSDHFLVGADAKVKSSFLSVKEVPNATTITNATPYTYFPKGMVHTAVFTSGRAAGFPHDAGTLITHYMNYDFACFQYFYPSLKSYKSYFRKWDTSTGTWGAWGSFDYSPVNEIKSITGTTVAASSSVNFDLTMTYAANIDVNNDAVVASPRGGIEPGVTWTVVIQGDKSVRLKIYNLTTSPITLATRNWHFKIVK